MVPRKQGNHFRCRYKRQGRGGCLPSEASAKLCTSHLCVPGGHAASLAHIFLVERGTNCSVPALGSVLPARCSEPEDLSPPSGLLGCVKTIHNHAGIAQEPQNRYPAFLGGGGARPEAALDVTEAQVNTQPLSHASWAVFYYGSGS
uniref:Uncharacterized protein n=1 Tax=Myotis myotis TaxID=51298 RepID=A0A7J7SRE5_MYOMY|nr:hypothetical protein mMyoMyo1_009316 [Myotis myotis]